MMFSKKLDTGEKTIVVIRKHWFVFAMQTFLLMLLAISPLVLAVLVPVEIGDAFRSLGVGTNVLIFIYLLFLLLIWIFIFISWTVYYLDAWVVTNRRIIDIEQRALFVRDITSLMLEKVQDVTVEINGIIPTVLGYGTLVIHTAGDSQDIRITLAAHPQVARDRIMECQRAAGRAPLSDGV